MTLMWKIVLSIIGIVLCGGMLHYAAHGEGLTLCMILLNHLQKLFAIHCQFMLTNANNTQHFQAVKTVGLSSLRIIREQLPDPHTDYNQIQVILLKNLQLHQKEQQKGDHYDVNVENRFIANMVQNSCDCNASILGNFNDAHTFFE